MNVFAIPIHYSGFLGLFGMEDTLLLLLMIMVADNDWNVWQKNKNDSLIR